LEQDKSAKKTQAVPTSCPHCGHKLTPWQQVLLATDRALVCKECWYRIILDVYADKKLKSPNTDKPKNKKD